MLKAARTNGVGIGLALVLSLVIGLVWPVDIKSHELMARTDVGMESIALALASGAAAVLSITTGLSSVLVGVMVAVAVALLPPTATLGLMLGAGEFQHALGAGLLLAVNIVCVNLAAKMVFLAKGIHPRTWWERKKARRAMILYILIWIASLALLVAAIYLRSAA